MFTQSLEGTSCSLKLGCRPVDLDLSVFDGNSSVCAADRAGYVRSGSLNRKKSLMADRADSVSILRVVIFDLGLVLAVCLCSALSDLMHMLDQFLFQIRIADRAHAVGIVVGDYIHHGRETEDVQSSGSHGSPVFCSRAADGNIGYRLYSQSLLREIIRVARHLSCASLVQHPVDRRGVMTAGITVYHILELSDRLQCVDRSYKNDGIRPADPVLYHLEIILNNALIVFAVLQTA